MEQRDSAGRGQASQTDNTRSPNATLPSRNVQKIATGRSPDSRGSIQTLADNLPTLIAQWFKNVAYYSFTVAGAVPGLH